MNDKQTILYVMRHLDIGGHVEIPYKKVGITGRGSATLSSRLQQISNTKSPIKSQCVAAWSLDDARAVESAIHLLLEDSRVEGEWFLDKDDTLVERMRPMMQLLGAQEIQIADSDDPYTVVVIEKENDSKSASHKTLLGEISQLVDDPLRTSIRANGPTFFSDKTELTYYINYRKSGNHRVEIGRSKEFYSEIKDILDANGFEFEQHDRGHMVVFGLQPDRAAALINLLESQFVKE